jgi:hypothetical protein
MSKTITFRILLSKPKFGKYGRCTGFIDKWVEIVSDTLCNARDIALAANKDFEMSMGWPK